MSSNAVPASVMQKIAAEDRRWKYRIEAVIVLVLALAAFILELCAALKLESSGAFDQFNLFFDADPNVYSAAIADGWSFNRAIHPGFALLVNVPLRAFDLGASKVLGLGPGALRLLAPLALPALCGLAGAVFFWLATYRAKLRFPIRIGAVLLFLGSFSQIVFACVPESYSISGMLFCILLWLMTSYKTDVKAAPKKSVATWTLLAAVMTGITVTNGIACLAVWLSLRMKALSWKRLIAEGLLGLIFVASSIFAFRIADQIIYSPDEDHSPAAMTQNIMKFGPRNRLFAPHSIIERAIEMPAYLISSIYAPEVRVIENPLAHKNDSPYDFAFSLSPETGQTPRVFVAWTLLSGLALLLFNGGGRGVAGLPFAGAAGSILAFNIALHSLWGWEVFLYSQHWMAFLVFAIALGLSRLGGLGSAALIAASVLVTLNSIMTCLTMTGYLARSM